jgi:hypothetical protein
MLVPPVCDVDPSRAQLYLSSHYKRCAAARLTSRRFADRSDTRGHATHSLEPVVRELDVIAQVAANEEIGEGRDPKQSGDEVTERYARGALRGE